MLIGTISWPVRVRWTYTVMATAALQFCGSNSIQFFLEISGITMLYFPPFQHLIWPAFASFSWLHEFVIC